MSSHGKLRYLIGSLVFASFVCVPSTLASQTQRWTIADLTATDNQPFDGIVAARELSDGRLILLDRGLFYVVNLPKHIRATVGRSGDGPGEYRAPLTFFRYRGDTSAYVDMARPRKVFLILPSGEFRGSIEVPADYNTRDPVAADGQGGLYQQHRRPKAPLEDSTDILRRDPANGKTDTVAAFVERMVTSVMNRTPGPLPPFVVWEQWAVGFEGQVAVVSVEPYRVTIFKNRRVVSTGPVLAVEPIPVSEALKRHWLEERMEPILTLVSTDGGPRSVTWRKRSREEVEPRAWPKFLPPFVLGSSYFAPGPVSFAPDGMLWIQRTTADPALPVIDIINGSGNRVGQLALPKGRKFVCQGRDAIYLVRMDEDGLQYLEKYSLPQGYLQATRH